MERGIDVELVLLPKVDRHQRIGRLIATTCDETAAGRWSGEARLHRDARTGAIALGAVVLASSTPPEACAALRGEIRRAWHSGADVRIVGPDRQPLSEAEAVVALRALAKGPRRPRRTGSK